MYAERAAMTCQLESDGNVYGLLTVSVTPGYAADEEERSLFGEVAGDIGFALRGVELERERSRTQEELRLSSLQWQNTFDATQDMIAIINMDYRIVRANRAMKETFKGKTVEGALCYNLVHGTESPPERCVHHRVVETGEPGHAEIQEKHLGGRWLDIAASAIKDESGTVQQVVHVIRDITDRRRAEEEVRQGLVQLRRTLEETVNARASVVEQRDPYTAGHQRRVAELACAVAEEMGLSQDQTSGLHLAGVIHDIGKMSVPAEILTKPGRLTEMEFNMIKTHSQSGFDVLKEIKFPWPIAQTVLQHHERVDGSGYPQGISGLDILLEARILGVADVVEAMASHRPYRPAQGISVALEEISEKKRVLYDPQVVDACLTLFAEKRFEFA